MWAADLITLSGSVIELLAAVVIAYHILRALALIFTRRDSDAARLVTAEGVLAALGFSVAASLLKIIALQSWPDIRAFAFALLLRTLLKRVFQWERRAIMQRRQTL